MVKIYYQDGLRMTLKKNSNQLTKKELKILALTYLGLSDLEIAYELSIVEKSLSTYNNAIHRKLGITSEDNPRCKSVKLFLELMGPMPVMNYVEDVIQYWKLK